MRMQISITRANASINAIRNWPRWLQALLGAIVILPLAVLGVALLALALVCGIVFGAAMLVFVLARQTIRRLSGALPGATSDERWQDAQRENVRLVVRPHGEIL